jgi:hypothetical protein
MFVRKQNFGYHEANHGQEAVDIYTVANGSVRCILMGTSSPYLEQLE